MTTMMTTTANAEQEHARRRALGQSRRWIVKVGSALATNNGLGLNHALIDSWCAEIAALRANGHQVVLVTSGSVAEGLVRLGWKERPKVLNELQAAAAVGQAGLVHAYENAFRAAGLLAAQILLTHDDVADRQRYLNARSTLATLLRLGVVPVVNENDTVAIEEIRFGDNDTLAALVGNLTEADLLVILTDQEGLYTADPREDPDATLVTYGQAGDPALAAMAGEGGALGRGGMRTKIRASVLAARSGTATLIAAGRTPGVLGRIALGDPLGTLLDPAQGPLASRKQWLAATNQIRGAVTLDRGAVRALREEGRSLLAVGITAVSGDFERGAIINCVDQQCVAIARGLVNYSHREVEVIKGHSTDRIYDLLGFLREPELIHRDNLVLL
jgi:glutamate 5-kinase